MTIQVLLTGGTIDKYYNPLKGELDFNESRIAAALRQGNCTVALHIEQLFLKDSLELNEADRAVIAQACRASAANQIVITHGTDTMAETARYLINAGLTQQTIVLVGAMIPLTIQGSDGLFNLGAALLAVQCLPVGVYVVMNGQVFPGLQVAKNRSLGVFEVG